MGVIKRGVLGGFSGRVANVVGSSWKGIAYMKALPLSVANPQTAAQTGQRTKFSACVFVAGVLLTAIVKPLWDRFAQGMSGYNDFVSRNIENFSSSGVLDYPNLKIAIGTLTGFDTFACTADASLTNIDFTWVNNAGTGNALASDVAFFAIYNVTQDVWIAEGESDIRSAANWSVYGEGMVAGDVLKVYGAFRRADGTLVSNTSFASVVVVA